MRKATPAEVRVLSRPLINGQLQPLPVLAALIADKNIWFPIALDEVPGDGIAEQIANLYEEGKVFGVTVTTKPIPGLAVGGFLAKAV
jgi:hypothetical protein